MRVPDASATREYRPRLYEWNDEEAKSAMLRHPNPGRPGVSMFARSPILTLCVLTLAIGACSRSAPSAPPTPSVYAPAVPEAGFLNGWRNGKGARELARTWYLTPQGSHLLDFDVFMSIPSATNLIRGPLSPGLAQAGFAAR